MIRINNEIKSLYGLKWNPFSKNIPAKAIQVNPQMETFMFQMNALLAEGGFAVLSGDPGLGKSTLLRCYYTRLIQDTKIIPRQMTRPQSSLVDFYREMGRLFEFDIPISSRYNSHIKLRENWMKHISESQSIPVLMIDEAQLLRPFLFEELKSLSTHDFDTKNLLTVILAGDRRLNDLLMNNDLLHIQSRIRYRLSLTSYSSEFLQTMLAEAMELAGASHIMTPGLIKTLSEKAIGNPRSLFVLADQCLTEGIRHKINPIDEKVFLQINPFRGK